MWEKIESQNDIDKFMEKIDKFHDSCIKEIQFTSGTYVDEDYSMIMNTKPCVLITYQRQSERYTTFELKLEYAQNICINTDLTMTSEILEAVFEKKENLYYWYSDLDYKNNLNQVTWFSCKSVEWRMV